MRRKRETERERRGRKKKETEGERETPNTYALAKKTQDHNRLPVPRSKQALSRRLQVPASTAQRLDSFVRNARISREFLPSSSHWRS